MSYRIEDIEGIGPSFASKLSAARIQTTEDLLDKCGNAAGRKQVAGSTGIGEGTLLTWANRADLMRISGVGSQFSELLNAAGVDTVKELATRNIENLTEAIEAVNKEKNLSRSNPSAAQVKKWVTEAKVLGARISH